MGHDTLYMQVAMWSASPCTRDKLRCKDRRARVDEVKKDRMEDEGE